MIHLVCDSLEEISASIIEEQAVSSLYVRKILSTNVTNVGRHLQKFRRSCSVLSSPQQSRWKEERQREGEREKGLGAPKEATALTGSSAPVPGSAVPVWLCSHLRAPQPRVPVPGLVPRAPTTVSWKPPDTTLFLPVILKHSCFLGLSSSWTFRVNIRISLSISMTSLVGVLINPRLNS